MVSKYYVIRLHKHTNDHSFYRETCTDPRNIAILFSVVYHSYSFKKKIENK